MANIVFDVNAIESRAIENSVQEFLDLVRTLEENTQAPIVVFQDGKSEAYYIKCTIKAADAAKLADTNAKLNVESDEAFRANRELLLENKTYMKMKEDAKEGREFNDIIVEYSTIYIPEKPLKVWGGQHRIHAIIHAGNKPSRYHGFRVYFGLSRVQRTEVALISNTNISVSNDTFDRMVEETIFGDVLRIWCQRVNLIPADKDFPDVGSKAELITVKLARTFIINFYMGKESKVNLGSESLDERCYEPYVAASGINADPLYEKIVSERNILEDESLLEAGLEFARLHETQRNAVINSSRIRNRKPFRNKALVVSVLCGWSFVAGLLQLNPERLSNHFRIPKTSAKIPDPLNAEEMSNFHHNTDKPTYRGLGTRESIEERRRLAHLFLTRSVDEAAITKKLMNDAVREAVAYRLLGKIG